MSSILLFVPFFASSMLLSNLAGYYFLILFFLARSRVRG
jgi:hypothetical protein